MADSCFICRRKHLLHLCLSCHNVFCEKCIPVHIKGNINHCFKFEADVNINKCLPHGSLARLFCTDCSKVVCDKCESGKHKKHKTEKLKNIPTKVIKEQTKQVERDLKDVKADKEKVLLQMERRQRHLDEFYDNIGRIKYRLVEQKRFIDNLIFLEILKLDKIEIFDNLSKFIEEMYQLKVRKRYNKELEQILKTISSRNETSVGFVQCYHYLNNIKPFLGKPPTAIEFSKLEVGARLATEEEIRQFLFKVKIGSSISGETQRGCSQNSDVTRTKAKDGQVEELRVTNKMIELMDEIVQKFFDAIKMKKSSTSVSFEIQEDLSNYPKTKKHTERFHYNMKEIMRTVDEQRKSNKKQFEDMGKRFEELEKQWRTEKTTVDSNDGQNKPAIVTDEFQVHKMRMKIDELQDRIDSMTIELTSAKRQLQHSENEKEDLKTRLSQIAGAKLISGNSSIADLGDKFRPTRIAEMYSELYDNEWTEALEEIGQAQENIDEKLIVRHLFILLQGCFKTCQNIAREQIDNLCRQCNLNMPVENLSEYYKSHFTEIRQLKDARKGMAYDVALNLKKIVVNHEVFKNECSKYSQMDQSIVNKVAKTQFAEKCTVVCWLMVVQDPEMYLDEELKSGIPLKKDIYKEFTKGGSHIDYSVWPALFLQKDGPLLSKGIAQCYH